MICDMDSIKNKLWESFRDMNESLLDSEIDNIIDALQERGLKLVELEPKNDMTNKNWTCKCIPSRNYRKVFETICYECGTKYDNELGEYYKSEQSKRKILPEMEIIE